MIGADDWPFTKARSIAEQHGIHITAVFGSAPNRGSTDLALDRILENFKQVSRICWLNGFYSRFYLLDVDADYIFISQTM